MKTKICISCNKEFSLYPTINGVFLRLRKRTKCLECSPYKQIKTKIVKTKCFYCHKDIEKKVSINSKKEKLFCNNSCSTSYYNKLITRRHKKLKICKGCMQPSPTRNDYCDLCRDKEKARFENTPLSEHIKKKKDANRFCQIREHARKKVKEREQKCELCGYSKHVEVAHIKEIHKFSPETLIKEINDPKNLKLLCPNCHWELDHGLIIL